MAATFKAQPENPIDYFARWLLAEVEVEREQQKAVDETNRILDFKQEHEAEVEEWEKARQEAEKA